MSLGKQRLSNNTTAAHDDVTKMARLAITSIGIPALPLTQYYPAALTGYGLLICVMPFAMVDHMQIGCYTTRLQKTTHTDKCLSYFQNILQLVFLIRLSTG